MYPYQQVQNAGHSPSNKPVNHRGSVVRLEKSHRNLTRVKVAVLSTTLPSWLMFSFSCKCTVGCVAATVWEVLGSVQSEISFWKDWLMINSPTPRKYMTWTIPNRGAMTRALQPAPFRKAEGPSCFMILLQEWKNKQKVTHCRLYTHLPELQIS